MLWLQIVHATGMLVTWVMGNVEKTSEEAQSVMSISNPHVQMLQTVQTSLENNTHGMPAPDSNSKNTKFQV